MRQVWSRTVPLKGWNTHLNWIKSGSRSRVMDVPYEIYEKRYGPTLLASGAINTDIVLSLGSELRDVVSKRRFKPDHLIGATATAVVGRDINTLTKARRAYNGTGRKATMHTHRYRVANLNSLMVNLHGKLDSLADLPSKPSWLVAIDITIYLDEGEELLIRMAGKVETYP